MSKTKRKHDPKRVAASALTRDLPDVESLLSLSPEKRYHHFVLTVRQTREIWILASAAARPCIVQADPEYLPVFPSPELALAFSRLYPKFKPKCLTYDEFIEFWLPGLAKDGINAGVIPNLKVTLWAMPPLSLKYVLEA